MHNIAPTMQELKLSTCHKILAVLSSTAFWRIHTAEGLRPSNCNSEVRPEGMDPSAQSQLEQLKLMSTTTYNQDA